MSSDGRRLTVAIVGRPNVGKSTLFNRIVGRRLALVDDTPGVTRDRRERDAEIGDIAATVIDTAGFEETAPDSLPGRMRAQTEAAVDDADIVLLLIDARAGLTPTDRQFADLLRRAGKPVVLVANKSESAAGDAGYYDAFALGLGAPVAVSAEHALGMGELIAAVAEVAEPLGAAPAEDAPAADAPLKIAIIGRPNAGKSTLVNRLIGVERLLTGPEAGITRDAIAVDWRWRDRAVRLIDTAGLRRKARIQEKLEKLSVGDALRAVRFAEVVVLVIDAEHPFEKQDLQLADLAVREGRALVLALAKWDLVDGGRARLRGLRADADRLLPQVRGVPVVTLSALRGQGLDALMEAVTAAHAAWTRRVSTGALNRWLADLVSRHPPPAPGGRRLKLRYVTQPSARPPTFVVFCSRPEALPESYRRYLVNGLRESFELAGVPLRLHLRKGDNPYAGR